MNAQVTSDAAAALAANSIPDFANRADCKGLAVVTGGSSGMGKAFAMRAASCGMSVMILDLSISHFSELEKDLKAAGAANVLTTKCDVSSYKAVCAAAALASEHFGGDMPITMICANAGYGGPPLLDGEAPAIQKQLDVLGSGTIWTFKAFQSRFLEQSEPCALVATSSLAGVFPALGSYGVGKHAAVAIMEALFLELRQKGKKNVSVHVLCPGVVSTGIGKNSVEGADHPNERAAEMETIRSLPAKEAVIKTAGLAFRTLLEEKGMPAESAADIVFDAISTGKFYLLMEHPDLDYSVHSDVLVSVRHQRLEAGLPPATRQITEKLLQGKQGMMRSVAKRTLEILQEAKERTPVPVTTKARL